MRELRRVAYVEDEPDIRELTQIALATVGGLEVRCWGDGEAALAGLAAFAPDLLLLDVMMPGMDGPELRRRAAADPALAHVPVAFMTAKSRSSEIEALRALGILGVVSKPYDPMTLADDLRRLYEAPRAAA